MDHLDFERSLQCWTLDELIDKLAKIREDHPEAGRREVTVASGGLLQDAFVVTYEEGDARIIL